MIEIGRLRYEAIGRDPILYQIVFPQLHGWDISVQHLHAAGIYQTKGGGLLLGPHEAIKLGLA